MIAVIKGQLVSFRQQTRRNGEPTGFYQGQLLQQSGNGTSADVVRFMARKELATLANELNNEVAITATVRLAPAKDGYAAQLNVWANAFVSATATGSAAAPAVASARR